MSTRCRCTDRTNLEGNEARVRGETLPLHAGHVGVVAARLEAMTSNQENLQKAKDLGWVTDKIHAVNAMKWNSEPKRREVDTVPRPVPISEAKEMMINLTKRCVVPLVVNRFHATRPLATVWLP